jgi:hypothetical protein
LNGGAVNESDGDDHIESVEEVISRRGEGKVES